MKVSVPKIMRKEEALAAFKIIFPYTLERLKETARTLNQVTSSVNQVLNP
jgi:hypothetical protein